MGVEQDSYMVRTNTSDREGLPSGEHVKVLPARLLDSDHNHARGLLEAGPLLRHLHVYLKARLGHVVHQNLQMQLPGVYDGALPHLQKLLGVLTQQHLVSARSRRPCVPCERESVPEKR